MKHRGCVCVCVCVGVAADLLHSLWQGAGVLICGDLQWNSGLTLGASLGGGVLSTGVCWPVGEEHETGPHDWCCSV